MSTTPPCIALLRHGPTAWNDAHRIQGQTDIPLSSRGRNLVRTWSLPPEFENFEWIASPLQRAMETAQLLTSKEVAPEPALKEMHWGSWEGMTLGKIRQTHQPQIERNEARGLDFRPPGGESPRLVQQRLQRWFVEIKQHHRSVIAVTHKGVIRAGFALATNWDMTSEPSIKLDWGRIHLFQLDDDALPHPVRLNIELSRMQTDKDISTDGHAL